MDIQGYINEIRALQASGQTTEHSFRPALSRLRQSIDSDLTVINEPKRLVDVGAPDLRMIQNGVNCVQRLDPIGRLVYASEQLRNMQTKVARI